MHPAIRTQSDELQDIVSAETTLDASDRPENRDMARQEFKADADINTLLMRFGVMPPQKEVYFGDVDYSIDLQQALSAVKQARDAWRRMPAEVKADFPTWQSLLNGLELGTIQLRPESEKPEETVTEPLQSAPTGGAQST